MIQLASVRCSEDAWQKRTKSARMVFRQVREMKEIMIATSNAHKVEEFTQMLAPLGYQVRSLLDLEEAIDIEENGTTFEENALIKARAVHERLHTAVISDDSGLAVDAMDGAPGVYSARFAGEDCNSEHNIDKVLHLMGGTSNRRARFVTVIALCKGDGVYTFEGDVKGRILTGRRGSDGFGYDSIFEPEGGDGLTFAEMTHEQKNAISHRGRAVRKLVDFLLS